MRVAAAQITTGLDKIENRARAVSVVKEAAERGAELVVLPEATLAAFGGDDADLVALAETVPGPFVEALAETAGCAGLVVVAGMFERSPVEGRVYNTVVALGPDGLFGAYRKFHLYDALGWRESARILPGDPGSDPLVVFSYKGLRFGVMNCYDLRFPEMARVLVDRGATVLLVPAHFLSGPGKPETWRTLLTARAIENCAYVVGAGKPGPECTGLSMVVGPRGQVCSALDATSEGLALADISADAVEETRRVIPVLENRRFRVVVDDGSGSRESAKR